jgi:hypothetical protein
MSLIHAFSSSKADGPDTSMVQASNWNADHVANSGGLNIQVISGTASVPVPAFGTGTIFMRRRAGKTHAVSMGSSGLDYTIQPHFGLNKVLRFNPAGNSNSLTVGADGVVLASTGTATARNANAGAAFHGNLRRVALINTNVSGANAGIRGGGAQFWTGPTGSWGGFFLIARFVFSSASDSYRWFCGFNTSTSNPVAGQNPSAFITMVGFGCDAADSNIFFMHNDASGAATKINTGIARMAARANSVNGDTTQSPVYEVRLFCPPNPSAAGVNGAASAISGSIEVLTPGSSSFFETSTSSSTDVPSSATLLNPHVWIGNGAATASSIDIISLYVETDN